MASRLPFILAGDFVGTVVNNGPNASFPIGAHVFAQGILFRPMNGGLQQYGVVDGRYTALVPHGVTDIEAALYPINAVTAAMALFAPNGLGFPFPGTPEAANFDYAAQKVAIVGGGSNVGGLAIQFAKLAGIGAIITVASASKTHFLKNLGATHVVARQDSDIEKQVRDIVNDDLLYVFDAVSKGDYTVGLSLLSNTKKGTFVQITHGNIDEGQLAKKKGGVDSKFVQGLSSAIPEFGQRFWQQFPKWLESGQVKPLQYKVIEGLDAAKVNAALDGYRDGSGERYHVRIS